MPDLFMKSAAEISPCGLYRYRLTRIWDPALDPVVWVMLNPSSADAEQDDPTIRRCMNLARAWGCGGIDVVNLFALRATDPREVRKAKAPVGPENDRHLAEATEGRRVIAAWGASGGHLGRDHEVRTLLRILGRKVEHLGLTRTGQPRHPLYLRADTVPVLWEG